MNILQLSTYDYSGGAERVARDLHRGLLEARCRSHLLVGRRRGPVNPATETLYNRDLFTGRAWARTRQYFESATGRQASASKAFARWWRANRQSWDVLVCHNLHGIYFDLDILPAVALAQPVVCILHDLWLMTGHCAYPMACEGFRSGCGNCPDLARSPAVWIDRTAQEWKRKIRIVRQASPTLVCVSRWVEEQLTSSGLADLPREVIPVGIEDIPCASETRAQIRRRLGWPEDKTIYLYVSSHGLKGSAYKDPATLIGSARELMQSGCHSDKFIVTVGGTVQFDPALSPLIRQYGHVAGGLEDFYRAADYFVYPTNIETAGIVLIEAARAGLPAITTNSGGCAEIVQHGETGLVIPPRQPRRLAEAMCEISAMERESLSQRARKRYENLFTRDRMVAAHINLFEKLHDRGLRTRAATLAEA